MSKIKKKSSELFYIKFHFNDVLSSTALRECNVTGSGVYFFIFCLLCKTKPRGRYEIKEEYIHDLLDILPRQNIQQSNRQISQHIVKVCRALAAHFVKHLPFTELIIAEGLKELLENDVIYLEANFLCQKRFIRDSEISAKRSIAGGKGAEITNKKNNPAHSNTSVELENNLPHVLPQQNNQQNPNYNSDYNYNSNLEDNKGVSNNTSGGMGEENSGGKEEGAQNEKDYEGNWSFLIPVVFCKHFYFKNNIFGNARDSALKVLFNHYQPPNDLPPNEQTENMLERLMLWADEYNEFLDRTEQKDSGGRALKTMQGPDCWPNHFHNWLKSQKSRLSKIPDRRIDYQHSENGNGKLNSTADIDEKIKNETDPDKRRKLREEKYKLPVRREK